jgi:hypothetical protein
MPSPEPYRWVLYRPSAPTVPMPMSDPCAHSRSGSLTRGCRAQALDPGRPYLPRALDLGYYDQAHAIHELRQLTGRTPTALFGELETRSHFYNPSRAVRP